MSFSDSSPPYRHDNNRDFRGIGGADYAIAFVDEIDNPRHHRALFTAAY
jgi:putative NADH-flavin reductase